MSEFNFREEIRKIIKEKDALLLERVEGVFDEFIKLLKEEIINDDRVISLNDLIDKLAGEKLVKNATLEQGGSK